MTPSGSERVALILGEPDEPTCALVGLALRRRGCRVVRASAEDLAMAQWHHSPHEEGTRIVLPDGVELDDRRIGVVLNRLSGPQLPQFAQAAADRDYTLAEFGALLASWLNGLAVQEVLVANPPADDNPWAPARHPLGWHALAAAHGLPVDDFSVVSSLRGGACSGLERVGGSPYPRGSDLAGWYRPASAGSCLHWLRVLGGQSVGRLEEKVAAACPAFVRALGLHYAALGFREEEEGLRLVELDPCPALDDDELAERCAAWLQGALSS